VIGYGQTSHPRFSQLWKLKLNVYRHRHSQESGQSYCKVSAKFLPTCNHTSC
jgi:hypothetical protein